MSSTTLPRRRPDEEPFPLRQIVILAICRLAEPIAFTSVTSYSYVMVRDLHGDENTSLFSGLIISAFAIAEACTAVFWGTLSDKYGRKPIILIGLTGTVISCLLLGFARNYWVAFGARLLGGLLNGNVAVIQTMVAEIVRNPKHEPIAYSLHPLTWNLGSILGSALGGYAAQPAYFYPDTFSKDGVFGRYPYLLPNLVCAVIIGLAICQCALLLEEPCQTCEPVAADHDSAISDDIDERTPLNPHGLRRSWSNSSDSRPRRPSFVAGSLPAPTEPLLGVSEPTLDTFRRVSITSAMMPEEYTDKVEIDVQSGRKSTDKVFSRDVVMWILSIVLLCFHLLAFTSVLPIYVLDTPQRTHGLDLYGGLGLTVHDVGNILAANSVWSLFVQVVIFPFLMAKAGVWNCVVWCTILAPVVDILVPFASILPNPMLAPLFGFAFRTFFYIMIYPGQLIMLKNAAGSTAALGRINGLMVSTASIGRTIAPPLAGIIYDAFGSATAWWSCAAFALFSIAQLALLRRPQVAS